MAIYSVKNLTFRYPDKKNSVLDNISFDVEEGEYITICGKSGCGKTTLLRCLKPLLTPHGDIKGEILYYDNALSLLSQKTQAEEIGYVMQNPDNQIVTDKVWHELAFGLESTGVSPEAMGPRIAEMASYFGIQNWFHRDTRELSGGEKQLLNLASVMVMNPQILILDEPTSQLDPVAAGAFLENVRKINRELGVTIIIAEHRLEDVFPQSDKVIVMDEGRIIAEGRPEQVGGTLFNTHSDMFCAMPAPVKIFYGLEGKGISPLDTREGRKWLTKYVSDNKKEKPSGVVLNTDTDKESSIDDIPVIELKDLWFRYEKNGEDILRGLNLKVQKGIIHTIVGGNGTGKTTTLKAICNVCKPYRGKIFVEGKSLTKYSYKELFHNKLAMLPQDPRSLFVKKTVKEELLEMVSGNNEQELDDIVNICMLKDIMDSHPYDLSGGEQQRVALGKVLLTKPKILLLDEPTKGLDWHYKIKLGDILTGLCRDGMTVLMVSHDLEFCAIYSDMVSMFFDGGITTTEVTNKFFRNNAFYTTGANKMSRYIIDDAITGEDVIELCKRI